MPLQKGVLVGPYEIVAPLGAGGMGEVYRARDSRLSRDVALKVLSGDLSASGEHLRRFELEARAASALNHPNIITIHDIGRSDSGAYIAMELIEGNDLRSLMTSTGVAVKQVLRIGVKVADGLAAAHDRGIIHRDLKPENVMISRDGYVKILDFGLAKLANPVTESDSTLPHTVPGAVFGTVGYMSPEQAAGRAVDFRSDQFALGTILYEMLSGRQPFSAGTAPETMAAIIRNEPPPLSSHAAGIPPELERIVMRCLSKSPDERYASTRDLARDLRELRDRTSMSSEERQRSGRAETGTGPRRAVWIGSIAIAIVVVAAAALMWQQKRVSHSTGTRALAIVPFREVSGSPEGQAFGDGISEMISARLAESKGLRIVTPFEGTEAQPGDAREIAKRHGATLLLRGAVQRAAGRVRVSYAIIDVSNGAQLVSDALTAGTDEIFSLEDQLADRILNALDVSPLKRVARSTSSAQLSSAEDQRAFVEATGLLRHSKDEKSVDRAIANLERLLTNARDSAMVNALLGRALYYKAMLSHRPGLVEEATLYAERAADLDPALPEVHVTLGQLRRAAGRNDEAVAQYQQALTLRPDMPEAVLGLGITYDVMGRSADAERLYQRAIALRPDFAGAYTAYGTFCYRRGRFADAARNYARVTAIVPDSARGYTNLGAAYQGMGRNDEALRVYERSMAIEPTAASCSNTGTLYFYAGRYAEASRAYEKATEIAPGDYLMWANLGDGYRWTPGMRERAVPAYSKSIAAARDALAVNGSDAVAHATIAMSLAKSGRAEEANSEINAALKLDPTNSSVLYDAALVAFLRGNRDAALNWLERGTAAGYPARYLARDPEFASLRNDADFRALILPRNKDQ